MFQVFKFVVFVAIWGDSIVCVLVARSMHLQNAICAAVNGEAAWLELHTRRIWFVAELRLKARVVLSICQVCQTITQNRARKHIMPVICPTVSMDDVVY